MDEFKKQYEYVEEKGVSGIMLILFFMLIAIEPFLGILAAFFGYNTMKDTGIIGTAILYVSIAYMIFSLFAGIALKRINRYAVSLIKVFLLFRLIFLVPFFYLNTRLLIEAIPYVSTYPLYKEMYNSYLTSFTMSMAYVVAFSVMWYIYLCKSKKVRNLFPQKKTGDTIRI